MIDLPKGDIPLVSGAPRPEPPASAAEVERPHRYKALYMSAKGIWAFMRRQDGKSVCRMMGVPRDCECVGARMEGTTVVILLWSAEWDIIPDDGEIPEVRFDMVTALLPVKGPVVGPRPSEFEAVWRKLKGGKGSRAEGK